MKSALEIIDEQEWLEKAGDSIQPIVLNTYEKGGNTGKQIKNLLHGKWLGHPVHPMITDVPLGAWTTTAILDTMELCGYKKFSAGADASLTIGLAGAAGAAVTGITDWSGTTSIERKTGLLHGMLNITATALYLSAYFLRKKKRSRPIGIGLSFLGYGITTVAAYLGGTLVYNKQVGVNHTAVPEGYPREFVPVLPVNELEEGGMKSVKAETVDVLLAKKNGTIYAIANTCTHLGGSLAAGNLSGDCTVSCPWHHSVFSLENGQVIDGPATQPQPVFETQIKNEWIEVKLKSGWV